MNKRFLVTNYDELKCISDELRMKISLLLIEKELTVTDISKRLDIPKAKIFYHIKELEKHKMIRQTKQVPSGGNLLKYYRSTHNGFQISEDLLVQHSKEFNDTTSNIVSIQIERTLEVLKNYGLINNNKHLISSTQQIKLNPSEIQEFFSEFCTLLEKYENRDKNSELFYLNLSAFPIEEKIFEEQEE